MKLTSKIKKNSIGPVLLIIAFIFYIAGMPIIAWYFSLPGLFSTLFITSELVIDWFDRDGIL